MQTHFSRALLPEQRNFVLKHNRDDQKGGKLSKELLYASRGNMHNQVLAVIFLI